MDYELGKHKKIGLNLFSVDKITWDAVLGASSYELQWEYPDPYHKQIADAGASCRNDRCEAEFLRNPLQREVTIRVRARAGSRSGDWSYNKRFDESIPCDASLRNVRWEVRREGLIIKHLRIYAAKDFTTTPTNGQATMISKGQRGGKIAGPGNIGIQGCSWIFPDASVQEHAELSGNALIYGNAEVSGSAKIHGEARVSGDARISGNAEIYGKAIVSGNARVSGDTVVKGDALIAGDMNLESGIYDGKAEFKRAAQELYKANRDAIVSGLVACKSFADAFNNTHSQATQIAADLLAGKNTIDSALAPLILACKNLKVIKSIIDSFTGKKSKILTAISFALPVVGSLRLSPMLLHIVELGSAGLDVYMLGDAKVLHDRLAAEYNTILGAN